MRYYQQPRQYNNLLCKSIKFPTKTDYSLVKKPHDTSKFLAFLTQKKDRPDIKRMPYRNQKQFFRLDREYDENLVAQHEWKTRSCKSQVQPALLANLVKERKYLFKKYLIEESARN